MLTATENQRVDNFTAGMDVNTANAMRSLFEITKPGYTRNANALFIAAYTGEQLPSHVVATFLPYGLVSAEGGLAKPVREAIQKAVAENYLVIHDPFDRALRPDNPADLVLH